MKLDQKLSPRSVCSQYRAFTRTDLLVSVAAVAVLVALIVAPLVTIRRKTRLGLCLSNLQQVSRAVLLYAENNRKVLPGIVSGQPGDL